jgi:hypothetical protein
VTLLNLTIDASDRNLKPLACWNRPGSTLASSKKPLCCANADSEVLSPLLWAYSIAGGAGDRLLTYLMQELMRLT